MKKLLNKDISVFIHYNDIHALAAELNKIANDMSPKIMIEVFKLRDSPSYNPFHRVSNGTESVSYLGRRKLLMGLKEKSKNGTR